MITIEIKSEAIERTLPALIQGLENPRPLMRKISGTMHKAVLENFRVGGRPKWAPTARGGDILVHSGNLRDNISTYEDSNSAIVGTNELYAAIHQFGGKIRPKKAKALSFNGILRKSVTIPARPFLALTTEDEDDIINDAQDYLRNLVR